MIEEELINKCFQQLDEWRNLPAYQLERRADIFFSLYISDIIKFKFNNKVDFIIPEFPVRLGNICNPIILKDTNASCKIDYVVVSNEARKVYFVELKTDDNSRRESQDVYLEDAKRSNIKNLVDGVLKIYEVTRAKIKYKNLINILIEIGWIDKDTLENISNEYEIVIIYIQPNKTNSNNEIVSFDELINIISINQDYLTKRFIKSLEIWKLNPNYQRINKNGA